MFENRDLWFNSIWKFDHWEVCLSKSLGIENSSFSTFDIWELWSVGSLVSKSLIIGKFNDRNSQFGNSSIGKFGHREVTFKETLHKLTGSSMYFFISPSIIITKFLFIMTYKIQKIFCAEYFWLSTFTQQC